MATSAATERLALRAAGVGSMLGRLDLRLPTRCGSLRIADRQSPSWRRRIGADSVKSMMSVVSRTLGSLARGSDDRPAGRRGRSLARWASLLPASLLLSGLLLVAVAPFVAPLAAPVSASRSEE